MNKITFLLLVKLIGLSVYVSGQTNPLPTNNKTASSMIGKMNMSNPYTGQMSITIPLFEYEDNQFGHDVSLSYSTVGTRVEDAAGQVGLGWNLEWKATRKWNICLEMLLHLNRPAAKD